MRERERRHWQRFDVQQEGVSNCSLLDKQGNALPMLIRDIGMGGLCLVKPRETDAPGPPLSPRDKIFFLSSRRVPRFGQRIDGRRVRVVWARPDSYGCCFDTPLFGQPTGLRRLLSVIAELGRPGEPDSVLVRLASRLGRR